MEGKNGKKQSLKEQQQSPQSGEGSTERNPSPTHEQRQPSPHHHSRGQRGPRGMLHPPPPPAAYSLHAIPVGTGDVGGGGGYTLAATSSIGGFATSRKRAREGAAGDPHVHDHRNYKVQYPFTCSMCGRGFLTDKSLFGHMRTHRDRAWKGALPPPVFSREEFADTGLLNPIIGDDDDGDDEADQEVDQPLIGHKEETVPSSAPPRHPCVLPDLNESPPTEGDHEDDDDGGWE